MRTFKTLLKGAALVALSSFVLGCAGGPVEIGPSPIVKSTIVEAGRTEVTVAAPDGFCIDRATIDENPRGAFMFLSDCRVLETPDGTTLARLPISAILTASISASGLGEPEEPLDVALTSLKGFLASPVGLFTLGKSHVEGAVSILNTKQTDAALYVLVQDAAFDDDAGASNRYWRAFTEMNGRLMVLTVTGYVDGDSGEARSLRILRAFVSATINANLVAQE